MVISSPKRNVIICNLKICKWTPRLKQRVKCLVCQLCNSKKVIMASEITRSLTLMMLKLLRIINTKTQPSWSTLLFTLFKVTKALITAKLSLKSQLVRNMSNLWSYKELALMILRASTQRYLMLKIAKSSLESSISKVTMHLVNLLKTCFVPACALILASSCLKH